MSSVKIWEINEETGDGNLPIHAVALLLDSLTSSDPAAHFHAFLSEVSPVDYLTHVRYVQRRGAALAAPELLSGHAAPDIRNTTAQCFAIYRERFWRHDECTALAQRLCSDSSLLAMVHFTPSDATAPAWRRDVYRRMQIEDRLSIVYSPVPDAVFGLSMYRARRNGTFRPAEIARLESIAPLLRQAHRALLAAGARAGPSLGERLEETGKQLRRRFPELSPRECEVCARIACGLSGEGIARDLQLSYSSVTTLRKRAYAKLRMHGMAAGRGGLEALNLISQS